MERQFDVDEFDLPRELLQERPHHQQVVAPDKLVPPARLEGVALLALVDVKEPALHAALLRLARGATLVDGLDDLEGQAHPRHLLPGAVLVVLAGPHQLGFGDLDPCHGCHSSPCSSVGGPPVSSSSAMLSQPWSKVNVRARPAGSWMRTTRA